MALGCVITLANFVMSYSAVKRTNFFPSNRGSSVVRNHRQRLWLSARRSRIVTLQLHGFVFFGNVVSIVADIEQRIRLPQQQDPAEQQQGRAGPKVLLMRLGRESVEYVSE